MAKIILTRDGNSISNEGPTSEIMGILTTYLKKNNLRVEYSTNEGNRMIHQDSNEFFGKVYVEV